MKRLIMGAKAIAEAAVSSGLEAYFGYPITPSSEIMENISVLYGERKYPWFKVFLQSASEIESVNMLFGAGAAGYVSMTATSGPGLSLMAEGISYAYASEAPFLIIDVNRGGPGLGNVAPEQSDISFVLNSLGHGGVKPSFWPLTLYRNPWNTFIRGLSLHLRTEFRLFCLLTRL